MAPTRRALARALEGLEDFEEPRADLEQYMTPADLAASIVHEAALRDDLRERTVVDLGTGTGILAIAAREHGPARVIGLDVDRSALAVARRNAGEFAAPPDASESPGEGPIRRPPIEWIRADVRQHPLQVETATVLSNPPFGAQDGRRHADRAVLEACAGIARVSYTIHNAGSEGFVEAFTADNDGTVEAAYAAELPIDRRFDFHDRDRATIPVEVYRIRWDGEDTD